MCMAPVSCKMCLVDAQSLGTMMGPLTKITESIENSIVQSDLYPTSSPKPKTLKLLSIEEEWSNFISSKTCTFDCSWGQTLIISELAFSVSLLSTKLVILKNFVNVFCLELSVLHLPYDERLKTLACIFLYIFPHINFQLSVFFQVSLWYIFHTLKSISRKYTASQCR